MFCTKCGNKVENDATFCSNCGNVISQSEPIEKQTNIAPKKLRNKMALIVSVCVVALILVVSVVMVIAKKTDNVTRIIKAYENTMNADNFDINMHQGRKYSIYEVYGKGSVEDTYIVNFYDKEDDWTKNITQDNARAGVNGNDRYCGGNDIRYDYYEDDDETYIACQWVAERDMSKIWNDMFGTLGINLNYQEAYDFATNEVLDYIKNQDASAIKDIEIQEDTYSASIDFLDFVREIECYDLVEAIFRTNDYEDTRNYHGEELLDLFDEHNMNCTLEIKVALDKEYLKSIYVNMICDNGEDTEEKEFLNIEFANVNKLTKESSVAYNAFNTNEY